MDLHAKNRAILERRKAVILESHFVYTADDHGTTYVAKDAVYPYTQDISDMCRDIAEYFCDYGVEVVIAPAVGGVVLSHVIARFLSEMTGREVLGVYCEHEETSIIKAGKDGLPVEIPGYGLYNLGPGDELLVRRVGMTIKRGYDKLVEGRRVLVVEDIVNTARTLLSSIVATRQKGGIVVGAAALGDRGENTAGKIDVDFFALVTFDFPKWSEDECAVNGPCAAGVPINTQFGKGKAYLERKAREAGPAS